MTEPTDALIPCPFCGAGETQIHVNKGPWNGRSYGDPVSFEVRHWCADIPGQPSRMISRAGRDQASAIAAWNTRTPQPTQAQAGAVPLTGREIELIDGMIQVQLDHASRCDSIANRPMADKQKGWDMERVALLQKLKAHGIKGGQHG